MKKILVICLVVFMCSCTNSVDGVVTLVIKKSQSEIERLDHIERITNDTAVINYINSYKKEALKEAYKIEVLLESKTDYFNPLTESKNSLKVYIDSLENK